jgi:hypothetical protein
MIFDYIWPQVAWVFFPNREKRKKRISKKIARLTHVILSTVLRKSPFNLISLQNMVNATK